MMSSLMTSIATLVSEAVTHPIGDTETMAGFLNNNREPSLIVLDMEMRDNKGRAILEFLVERKTQVGLILINAQSFNDSGTSFDNMNIAGHFNKPLNYRALYTTIKKVLEEKVMPQA